MALRRDGHAMGRCEPVVRYPLDQLGRAEDDFPAGEDDSTAVIFDAILNRVKEEGVAFRSEHDSPDDGQINHNHQGRGFYFRDANDHSWEVITHTYI